MARGPFEWDEDLQRLGERVDDFVDRVFGAASAPRYGLQHSWRPSLDVFRVADGIVVITELPGVDEADLLVVAENGRLRIAGTRPATKLPPPAEALRLELDYGPFERVIALPAGADPDGISATFQHGLLTVRIPVREQRRPIAIRNGDNDDPPPRS